MEHINNKLSDKILNEIPDFRKYAERYLDVEFHNDVYLLLGTLGGFLRDSILEDEESSNVTYTFSVINESYDEFNIAIKETIFEMLMDFKKTITISQSKLNGHAIKGFEEVLNSSIFNGGKFAK